MVELTRAQAAAAAVTMVDTFAPDAPAEVRSAAASMCEQSILDAPYDNDTHFSDQQTSTHNLGSNHLKRSGASSILAPWRRPRARVIEEAAS